MQAIIQGRPSNREILPASPRAGLGWLALVALVLLLAGGFFFFRAVFSPAGELPSLIAQEKQERPAAAPVKQAAASPSPAAIDPNGAVVFTALEDGVWIKFYDADGRQLMQKQMAKGETYVVPQDAKGPQVWTGQAGCLRDHDRRTRGPQAGRGRHGDEGRAGHRRSAAGAAGDGKTTDGGKHRRSCGLSAALTRQAIPALAQARPAFSRG